VPSAKAAESIKSKPNKVNRKIRVMKLFPGIFLRTKKNLCLLISLKNTIIDSFYIKVYLVLSVKNLKEELMGMFLAVFMRFNYICYYSRFLMRELSSNLQQ
jgi:hypothetical protein